MLATTVFFCVPPEKKPKKKLDRLMHSEHHYSIDLPKGSIPDSLSRRILQLWQMDGSRLIGSDFHVIFVVAR